MDTRSTRVAATWCTCEKYLRPVYVAHAAGIAGATAGVGSLNHSAIARQLGIADGTTVRRWVERYMQRFSGR